MQLYNKYGGEGLEILAFPCNQFGGQEPGTNAEVLKFAERKGAKFPVMAKVKVNGAGAHPLFAWLKDNTSTGFPPLKDIPWNFGKFLIDRNGVPSQRYAPTSSPLSMESDIKALLAKEAKL